MDRPKRISNLLEALKQRVLILDGATGTALQNKNLTAKDFGGEDLLGCNESLNLVTPNVISDVHSMYLEAGADIIETNTFGATPLVLNEYELSDKCYEINFKAAQLAREVADSFSTDKKPRFVAGSMGPTTKSLSITGGISFEELAENYYQQSKGLYDGGIDYFLLETSNDTRNIKAGIVGINRLLLEKDEFIPTAISVTIEDSGTMLAGQDIEALSESLAHLDLLYIGLNCATGPKEMKKHIVALSKSTNRPLACVPNAGLPNEFGKYTETPEMFAKSLKNFVDESLVNILGGCCGTIPPHIEAVAKIAANKPPRCSSIPPKSILSGIDVLRVDEENKPIMVGERTNVIGSKKFRTLITDKKFDEAADIAKHQVLKGAKIIDVCLANPDSNELDDMQVFLEGLVKKIRTPLMIDSIDPKVIAKALPYSQGKAIINSINLENGESKFKEVTDLIKTYGGAVVVGTIDENPDQGMAVSRERKLEIATRSYDLLTKKYNIPEVDLYFDPLVFPCATGDKNYEGSAVETIEGIRDIKKKFPNCKTVLGISNVSFGLPMAGRKILNSIFLHHTTEAGLDLAIVNSAGLEDYSKIDKLEIELAENLIWNRGNDPIMDFTNYFREKKPALKKAKKDITPSEFIIDCVVNGIKTGLTKKLDILLENNRPLEIINGPLMEAMRIVGKLFNKNEVIVVEVLQSAEVMKTSVDYLKKFIPDESTSTKGKFLLATVKGDVHDIGKNLVDIILSNNGYEVINMGIKIDAPSIIEAVKKHKPDILGLSGLLVKSALQMTETAKELNQNGINVPIIVGGAALSQKFVDINIQEAYPNGKIYYAKDVMKGLEISNSIISDKG